jgi:hypothetical protein
MKDMPRLLAFRDQIIKPILEPLGFHVNTPESGDIGNVMRQVLLRLEQADILIADITGNNPNVMYELGVYHSFGKPYVIIKEDIPEADATATAFDIAEYRFHAVNFSKPADAIKKLAGKIDLRTASMATKTRPFSFSFRVNEKGEKVITDIPTILSTLNESITQRRKSQQRYFSNVEWEVLEQRELERFSGKCESHVQNLEETYPECTGKIKVLWGWTP